MKVRSLVKYLKFHGITTKDLKKILYDIHTEKEGAVPPPNVTARSAIIKCIHL